MTIRVKDKRVGIRKRERTESKERNDREKRRTQRKQRFGKVDCLITNFSVDVGYGLCFS